MANKLKAQVWVNEPPGVGNIELVLTDSQAVTLLEHVVSGNVIHINLKTNGKAPSEKFDYAS